MELLDLSKVSATNFFGSGHALSSARFAATTILATAGCITRLEFELRLKGFGQHYQYPADTCNSVTNLKLAKFDVINNSRSLNDFKPAETRILLFFHS